MTETRRIIRVFVSAAEPSADNHCAHLISALNQRITAEPALSSKLSVEWVGIGGEKMETAGCKLLANPVGRAAMIYNAFAHVKYFYGLIKESRQYLGDNPVDLVIVCDSPAFNFHIAKAARKNGIPTLFYVAPQLWAWAAWRIRKLRKWCSKLACILPFEKDWFTRRNVDTTFVGNPLFDDLGIEIRDSYRNYADFDVSRARIALFPGSRPAEVNKLWPAMQQIALRLKNRWPNMKFVASAADQEKLEVLKSKQEPALGCDFVVGRVAHTARHADLALVTSGSATLQVAAAGCPMVIMYQSSRLLWNLVGKWLVRTRFLSLVNILGRRQIVPEYMPYFTSIDPIVETCFGLLGNRTKLREMSHNLASLVEPIARGNASDKTAQIALEMLVQHPDEKN